MRELNSNAKGVIAETAIELAAHRCNIGLYRPASGHSRPDMLFEIGADRYRVQVKWATARPSTDLPPEVFADRHAVQLRLTPARNNQLACINLADEYDFAGAVAQLGERHTGSVEARGSSPLSSTASDALEPTVMTVGSNPFRDRLGYWMDIVAAGQEVIVTRRGRPRLRLLPAVLSR